MHVAGGPVKLLIDLEVSKIKAGTPGDSSTECLLQCESFYRLVEVYCWLAWRLPKTFIFLEDAKKLKTDLVDLIHKFLVEVTGTHGSSVHHQHRPVGVGDNLTTIDRPHSAPTPAASHSTASNAGVRVIVNNIRSDMTTESLQQMFSMHVDVVDCRVNRQKDGTSTGFAFVVVRDQTAANQARARFDNTKLSDRKISVAIVQPHHGPTESAPPTVSQRSEDLAHIKRSMPARKYGVVEGAQLERAVRRFYQHYNPSKLKDVPGLLEKYKGRGSHLLLQLEARYGPPPAPEV